MDVSELLAHIAGHPNRLFVRNFIDFSGKQPMITSELLHIETHWSTLVGAQSSAVIGQWPHTRKGYWSDLGFTQKHLHPRLEAHPAWLAKDQVITVARLADGSIITGLPPVGRAVGIHLTLVRETFNRNDADLIRKLDGILREDIKRRDHWSLLL